METWIVKVICAVVILVITIFFGLLPFAILRILEGQMEWRTSRPRANFILGCLNSFGGGVFLGTAFLHLLPEVEDAFDDIIEKTGWKVQFPLSQLAASVGLFLIMIIEHVILTLQHHHNDVSLSLETSSSGPTTDNEGESTPVLHSNAGRTTHSHRETKITSHARYGATDNSYTDLDVEIEPGTGSHGCSNKRSIGHKKRTLDLIETGDCVHVIEADHHQHHHLDSRQLQGIRSFVLLLALSLHTIFEGLALGLQKAENRIWTLLLALSIHKVIIAFTLGLQFAEHLPNRRRAVMFILLFSLMAPVGIAIGTSITEASNSESISQSIASAILQGLASGTFIYVTFFEVLQKEVGQDHSLLKVLCIIVGFSCMAGMVFLE